AEELQLIDAAIRRSGESRGVVLAGAAGVGKTRLAREALAVAHRRGAVTRWAVGTASARGLPLGAFAAQLGSVSGDPPRLLQQATTALLAGAGRAGVVVGVDDAHLLDELSALLVHQLVLTDAAVVVVTVRTGEPAPDAVTALWKDGQLGRLEVQPLSESETAALLAAVLDGPPDSASAHRMWALCRGNALYLRQIVDGECEARRLRKVGGVWQWAGTPAVSSSLVDLMETRMGKLPQPVGNVVDMLAFAEPLGVTVLAGLTDAVAVEQAETQGLVSVEQDGRRLQARLAHPLYGEVRRARTGQLRGRRLRGQIATALACTGARRADDTLRRAVLALDSDLPPDLSLLTTAARCAVQLFHLPLAERLAQAAVAAGGGFDSRLTRAYALSWQRKGLEAEAELAKLRELASTDTEQIQVTIARAGNLFWNLCQPADAEAVLNAAEAALTDRRAGNVLTAMRAAFHGFLGRPHQAVRSATDALASETLPNQATVLATWGLIIGLGVLGRADELDPVACRGYAAASGSFELRLMDYGMADMHMIMLRLAGYVPEAERIALDHRATRSGIAYQELYGVVLLGHAALARGHLQNATSLLREARAGLTTSQAPGGWKFHCLLNLTQALAMAGNPAAARQALTELESERHLGFPFLDPEIALARAWVAAAEGAVSEAITLAHKAAAVAVSRGQVAYEVLALHTVVRLGDGTVADRLAELARQVNGPRAPAAAAHAAALVTTDGDALQAASVQLEQMGDLLAAADAAAHAVAAYRQRAATGLANAATTRAHRLAWACQGARTPALITVTQPFPLTRR
ncbi:MAG: helix-turn-helix transcriptional regulator, partial [Actinobacteria bacterium]|nr:helix-turn-helix transcriptional regulator [Actinomycetota bacterium]